MMRHHEEGIGNKLQVLFKWKIDVYHRGVCRVSIELLVRFHVLRCDFWCLRIFSFRSNNLFIDTQVEGGESQFLHSQVTTDDS